MCARCMQGVCKVCSICVQHVAHQTGKEDETVRQLRQRVAILLVSDNVAMFDFRSLSVIDGNIDIDVQLR